MKITDDKQLMDEGFDPHATNFSKKAASLPRPIVDLWAISKDNKLLHWGPIFTNKDESDNLKKDAEDFAEHKTGISLNKLKDSSPQKRHNWYNSFHSYYLNQIADMPSGWYKSEDSNVKNILKNAMDIDVSM